MTDGKFRDALSMKNTSMLVTGGAGFIGSNFIRYILRDSGFAGRVINFDKPTYAGNLMSLEDVSRDFPDRYTLFRGDIRNSDDVERAFKEHAIGIVVHFAAESHVDRSIVGPKDFVETNVNGTFNLLEAARSFWKGRDDVRFHHVSTDEVYGSLGEAGYFYETTPYDPRSPYSASKAASDHLVRAYYHTYGLPMTLSNCSNNYGPYQFPEKLIPVIILNALEGKPLPIYGDGKNVRDWLFVEDHCEAIWKILEKGACGETYNIGGECEKQNIDIVRLICVTLETLRPSGDNPALKGSYDSLIKFVSDRPGHDRRYAIDCKKITTELGWRRRFEFQEALVATIKWYLENTHWIDAVRSGEYMRWIEKNYENRS